MNEPRRERTQASVYIGVVGSELEYGFATETIRNIKIRIGDRPPQFIRATKGFDARNAHIDQFLNHTDCGAILLLDADMSFPVDTLERLREHGVAYVSGYYMRRQYQPIMPVMFEPNPDKEWPFQPMVRSPHWNSFSEIGASGWGCVLVHREVFEAVAPLLKGEPFVAEDDMDVYPYDISQMIRLINFIENGDDVEQMREAARGLRNEFRPLRGLKDNVGSDIRFPFFAREAGYKLYLDASVRAGHVVNYFLTGDDYEAGLDVQSSYHELVVNQAVQSRQAWHQNLKGLKYE